MRARPRIGGRPAASGLGALALGALVALGGCELAPRYDAPHYVVPEHYQGAAPFALARPGDALPRGPWWQGFGDPLLNRLERQLEAENPDLAALAEQYTQARDL